MAVQRKVFRIEEHARKRAPDAASVEDADSAERHREFMAELQSLRALVSPAAAADRSTMERARAQIAEAQAYKCELDLIYAAIKRTVDEVGLAAPGSAAGERLDRAGAELRAIVTSTEQATQAILQAAEDINQTAVALCAALKSDHDKELAVDIQERVVRIFEACNFQDLTGQRVTNVTAALKILDDHVARLRAIWQGVETFKPIVFDEPAAGDHRFLNGPKLPDDPGHSTQDDIDGLFGCA